MTTCKTEPAAPAPLKKSSQTKNRQTLFLEAVDTLRKAGVTTPELDARLLLCHALNCTHEDLVRSQQSEVAPEETVNFQKLIGRRQAREPVSRILGKRPFWKHEFAIAPSTLDPRPDTETLVAAVLALVKQSRREKDNLRIADLGTGTGCILLSLLDELENTTGVGIDCSKEALQIAHENAKSLGLQNRVNWIAGDWLAAVEGSFDVILSNPPYIPTQDISKLDPEVSIHDPRQALDGGQDGLSAYRAITTQIATHLSPQSWLLYEVGDNQAEDVTSLLHRHGFQTLPPDTDLCQLHDLSGTQRVVAATQRTGNCG